MPTIFTRTREQLARSVLRKLQVLRRGGSDVSADMDVVYEAVDMRLKSLHKDGIFWRKVDEVALGFTVPASTISASATADILFPVKMVIKDGSIDSPVDIIGITEYAAIADKTEAGLPRKALWKGGAEFLFWPIPTASASAGLVYQKIIDDTSAGSAPDVEVSMLRWLKDLVTYDVGDDFQQPEDRMARFMKEAIIAERNIRKLAVQRVDISTVAVDEWGGRSSREETDYGR